MCIFTAEPDLFYISCTAAAAAQAILTRTINIAAMIAFAVLHSYGCQHTQHLCIGMDTTALLESLATTAVALLQCSTCCQEADYE